MNEEFGREFEFPLASVSGVPALADQLAGRVQVAIVARRTGSERLEREAAIRTHPA